MKNLIALAAVLGPLCGSVAFADETTCTTEMANAAESVPDFIESWKKMHDAFAFYGVCDDGGVAEAFSDAIVRLLVSDWAKLEQLRLESRADSAFLDFVMRHIDVTASRDDMRKLETLATTKCPKDAADICARVVRAIHRAIHEVGDWKPNNALERERGQQLR